MEITSPCDGIVKEIFVEEGKEMEVVGGETKIFSIEPTTESTPTPTIESTPTKTPESTPLKAEGDFETTPLSAFQKGMLSNMSLQVGDTMCFQCMESIKFDHISQYSKDNSTSPVCVLVKELGQVVNDLNKNIKLSSDRKSMLNHKQVDIGVAIDVYGQLRV